jgi:hypothetical protein
MNYLMIYRTIDNIFYISSLSSTESSQDSGSVCPHVLNTGGSSEPLSLLSPGLRSGKGWYTQMAVGHAEMWRSTSAAGDKIPVAWSIPAVC